MEKILFSNYQRTIKHPISCFGIGLHTGLNISLTLLPADEDTGILFCRTDIESSNSFIPAKYDMVSGTMLGTTLSNKTGVQVSTVEHLMAAIWGCRINNLLIKINGPEIPIMDGSAEPFVFMLECAGFVEQNKGRKVIEVLNKVEIKEGDAYASVEPSPEFSVTMEIDFPNKIIANQKCFFDSRSFSFKMDLCRARTFGFVHEVEKLRSMGLALGGSLDNAIVIDEDRILNTEGLRYKDEFVRHKVLDSIGDFNLAGAYIKGHFHGIKSGHAINNKLLHKLFSNENAWRVVEMPIESTFIFEPNTYSEQPPLAN
jgi:UDP-3-O-[3-hydroxymyristoyl] N-acetylglucosamine deacetylase